MLSLLTLLVSSTLPTPDLQPGSWRAWLESPGGQLPFGLDLSQDGDTWQATVVNGSERIEIPEVEVAGEELRLAIPHYDSGIRATIEADGTELRGEWTKRSGTEKWSKLPFRARAGIGPRFEPLPASVASPRLEAPERWHVQFEKSDDPSVMILRFGATGTVEATFLTTTGDYRFLAGSFEGNRLRLSCFDGAHAFLFDARLDDAGRLRGDFWSRDSWHETWTATPDLEAALPDAFEQTKWIDHIALADLEFPDLTGKKRSLADPAFDGRARILYVFGSWCPNCHDQAAYLKELQERFGPRGLSILGLAFELTDDFERNVAQIRRYQERHGSAYPILIAGPSDKKKATEALKALDRVRSYPTTIFLTADGEVVAVHTGFSGPATGPAYDNLRSRFESILEGLLSENGDR